MLLCKKILYKKIYRGIRYIFQKYIKILYDFQYFMVLTILSKHFCLGKIVDENL